MEIEIRKLTPELAEDYVRFFDETPHDEDVDEHKCYCVCYAAKDSDGEDFSTREKRRQIAQSYVRGGQLQGYLAYRGDEIVGWCNANVKAQCLGCVSWRMFMGDVPVSGERAKSVFCFVIAPSMQRQGIATKLLARVCEDAAAEGFTFVEAYPNRTFVSTVKDYAGPVALYERAGFETWLEMDDRLVMRKTLN